MIPPRFCFVLLARFELSWFLSGYDITRPILTVTYAI